MICLKTCTFLTIGLQDYSVILMVAEHNGVSADVDFNVLLMGKCMDQLLGLPASKLHMWVSYHRNYTVEPLNVRTNF